MLFLWHMRYTVYRVLTKRVTLMTACLGMSFFLKSCLDGNSKSPTSSTLIQVKEEENFRWLMLNVDEVLPPGKLITWVPTQDFETSSLIKVPRYPRKFKEDELVKNPSLNSFTIHPLDIQDTLRIFGIRNEQISAQLVLAARDSMLDVKVSVGDLISNEQEIFESTQSRVRMVKYLPVSRARSEYVWSPMMEEIIGEETSGDMNPNVVADALIDFKVAKLEPYTAQPFWFTFKVPSNIRAGVYNGHISFSASGAEVIHEWQIPLQIEIDEPTLPDPDSYGFHLDLWFNPSSISEYYRVDHWSEEHWQLIKVYLEDYLSRGGKNITTVFTHEPWHKPWINGGTHSQIEFGYKSMVNWIKTEENKWQFDYTIFDKYVELAMNLGIKGSINAYSMTPFRTDQKIKFWDQNVGSHKEINLGVFEEEYAEIWEAFLLDFKRHLIEKGWYENTFLGFDEKPDDVLYQIMAIIEKSAPELLDRIIIAGHPEATIYAQNLSISYMFFPDQPLEEKAAIPVLPEIVNRNEKGKVTTFYLCAEPSHPNTLTYSPAIEARLIPWLALKHNTDGYLRWAYNNWTSDPFNKPVFLHSQGDDYYIYPGENGPISSIRWELLKEGIEDFELFSMIRDKGSINKEDQLKAIKYATQNEDGRYKDVNDFKHVRSILLKK